MVRRESILIVKRMLMMMVRKRFLIKLKMMERIRVWMGGLIMMEFGR